MPIRSLLPKVIRVTSPAKIVPRIWKEEGSIYKRLPDFYKKSYLDYLNQIPKPVHFIPKTEKYEVNNWTGEKKVVQNVSPIILYPKQAKLGIWGGEGVVFGYKRPKIRGYSRPQYLSTKLWRPRVKKLLFYSEILNKYYALTCTRRTLNLIEEAQGFDNYILKTHIVDLNSDFATQLKREILITLAKKDTDLYPNDPAQREIIYNRYKEFIIPLEQAEWFGLYPWEAAAKQKKIEEEEEKKSIKPLKEKYGKELIALLKQLKIEGKELPPSTAIPEEKQLSLRQKVFDEIKNRFIKN